MLVAALSAGAVFSAGCAAKTTSTAGAAPSPDVEVAESAHWTTNIQSVLQSRGGVAQSTRDRSYGNFSWTHGPSPSLSAFNIVVALTIGTIKAAIVAAIFMELRDRGPYTFVFAGAGLFWLGLLLWLGMMDFLTRT